MAYKDREDEIIQSGIGRLEMAYKNGSSRVMVGKNTHNPSVYAD